MRAAIGWMIRRRDGAYANGARGWVREQRRAFLFRDPAGLKWARDHRVSLATDYRPDYLSGAAPVPLARMRIVRIVRRGPRP